MCGGRCRIQDTRCSCRHLLSQPCDQLFMLAPQNDRNVLVARVCLVDDSRPLPHPLVAVLALHGAMHRDLSLDLRQQIVQVVVKVVRLDECLGIGRNVFVCHVTHAFTSS